MMASHKNLHELLKEDQEPFLLKNYIADRRSQLKTPTQITTLQPTKRKSIVQASTSKRNLCKHACFLSFNDSPDVCKSPFSDFPSPATAKSMPNRVRLHIPARTAALLFEAATKIHKPSSPKPRSLSVGFGLIGSILKRLTIKSRNRKCEIVGNKGPSFSGSKCEKREVNSDYENSRRNSTVWSESNGEEEKSIDSETSTSARSDDSEIDYTGEQLIDNGGFSFPEKHFCSSPLSPFRFALERYPSPGRRTPIFSSPAASPIRPHKQENDNCDQENSKKTLQEEEEEEKEQCSPVSVLDRLFEDDYEDDAGHEEDEEDDYDMECSYATVQRSKMQLLQKLRRFEKLAELDPVELEKRMLEEYNSDDETDVEDCEGDEENNSTGNFVIAVLKQSGQHFAEVSADMKRLVGDLVAEEESEWDGNNETREAVVTRVCERLDSWNGVESNTIDMMVELDLRRQVDGWQREDKEQVRETARDIEVAIFGFLMEEVSQELGLGC